MSFEIIIYFMDISIHSVIVLTIHYILGKLANITENIKMILFFYIYGMSNLTLSNYILLNLTFVSYQ